MDKVAELHKLVAVKFKDADLSNPDTLKEIGQFMDDHIHQNWTVLGSLHFDVEAKEDLTGIVLLPKNLFSAVLLDYGRVAMDKMTGEYYQAKDAYWLWREKKAYKCIMPEEPTELGITFG